MQLLLSLQLLSTLATLSLLPPSALAHPLADGPVIQTLTRRVDVAVLPHNNASGNVEPLLPLLIEPTRNGSWADAISDFNHKWVRPKFNATEHDPAITIVTCMDGRIMPEAQYGIPVGKANVLRSAGGRPQDVLGSILVSQHALGSQEIAVFHHTDCGMQAYTSDKLRDIILDSVITAKNASSDPDSSATPALNGTTVKKPLELGAVAKDILATVPLRTFTDLEASLVEDVEWLKGQELINPSVKISGWVHNVTDGTIMRVA